MRRNVDCASYRFSVFLTYNNFVNINLKVLHVHGDTIINSISVSPITHTYIIIINLLISIVIDISSHLILKFSKKYDL